MKGIIHQIRQSIIRGLRLNSIPHIRAYRGYSNGFDHMLFGHVLDLSPRNPNFQTKNFWTTSMALLRLFMVSPVPDAVVTLEYEGELFEAKTQDDGFFKFEWKSAVEMPAGIYPVTLTLKKLPGKKEAQEVSVQGELMVPNRNQYACVSDIDDTFLISHSANMRKRLKVLLTHNAHSRKPFEGVVRHYQLLADAGTRDGQPNAFFYVSSSEWNLYEYIRQFNEKNELPEGVFLLSQIKTLSEALNTGQNRHATKFMRIARIFEAFIHQQFILMGDDSQQDAVIYASVARHFPKQVRAVYLRHVHKGNAEEVARAIAEIEAAGIPCCHFSHSHDAIEHSIAIGLINRESLEKMSTGTNRMA